MEPRQRRLRVIRRLLCLFLFLFLASSSIRKFHYSVKEARHFAAESLIHLAKDLDEEIDVSRFTHVNHNHRYNSAQRRSEREEKEEPEVYERPSSPMPPADPSAPPPPPVAPSMPPPDDAMRR